jgi:hypothetical protein
MEKSFKSQVIKGILGLLATIIVASATLVLGESLINEWIKFVLLLFSWAISWDFFCTYSGEEKALFLV